MVSGGTLLEKIRDSLGSFAASVTVVADRNDKYSDLGFETIADIDSGLGPLGGLKTALTQARSGWLIVASCDLAGIELPWIAELLSARTPDAGAVAFKGERWEPLIALYHTRILADVEAAIAANELAMWRLIERVRGVAVKVPADWSEAAQINTPEALNAYVKKSKV